jgi:hypothetical protein
MITAVLAVPMGLLVADCKSDPKPSSYISPSPPRPVDVSVPAGFKPVELPDPKIAGFQFPEPSKTVEGWADSNDVDAMAKHAWGLWTALTMDSGQSFEGEPLRVFETWYTLDDLEDAVPLESASRRAPRPLGELEQLARGREKKGGAGPQSTTPLSNASPGPTLRQQTGERELAGFIKFNPPAADHIARNGLISSPRLMELVDSGETKIAPFPNTAVSIKAIYSYYATTESGPARADAGNPAAPYALFPVWSGPTNPPAPSPSQSWKSCVWIDLLDTTDGPATSEVDTKCDPSGSSRTPATTYGLGRFIHFTVTAPEVAAQSAPSARSVGSEVNVGDVVVLAGMHVTTRETEGWTWETFFWTPAPDDPPTPSSRVFASDRPDQLTGAPRGYASCAILSMQLPAQPLTGGATDGESVYCYNPYLEAQFTPKILPDSRPGRFEGRTVRNDVGSETNCMACHAQANFAPQGKTGPSYTADRYVDLASPDFAGLLQTDFLWSLPDTAATP